MLNYDFITNWAALSAVIKLVLTEIAGCMCAMQVIMNDMNGIPGGQIEAQTRLDVLDNRYKRGMEVIRDSQDVQTLIGKT